MKNMKSRVRGLVAALLTISLAASAAPVFAAERPVPEQGTAEYLDFISKTPQEQMEYIAGGKDTPEYRQFIAMYVDQLLTHLPSEPEGVLTYLPAQSDEWSWKKFFGSQPDYQIIRDEAYRIAKELDLGNPNLSQQEKASRIDGWAGGEKGKKGELLNTNGEVPAGDPWIVTEGLNVYHAGPLINHNRNINGVNYDCDSRAAGLLILYRTAGIPACYVGSLVYSKAVGHVEAGYYLNGVWWVTAGRNYGDGQPINLVDYTVNPTGASDEEYLIGPSWNKDYAYRLATGVVKPDPTGQKDTIYDFIIDLNVSWIRPNVEEDFMNYNLFYSQFIHNEMPLTRGDVAKLLCNYLNVAPMRNEQVFLDVELSNSNSCYIWAVNRMGIMTGDSDNRFHPNNQLTMQEFAVVAARIVDWGGQRLSDLIAGSNGKRTTSLMTTPEQRLNNLRAAESAGSPKTFADASKIASWAKPAVDKLSSLGILSGDGNGYLKPTDTLDRLRFAILLYKLDVNFGKHGEGLITGLSDSVVF
jgi:hypothetical protein